MAFTGKKAESQLEYSRSKHKRARARLLLAGRTDWPAPCAVCGRMLALTDDWTLGHIAPQRTHPHLRWQPENWRVECRRCNLSQGGALGNAIRRGEVDVPAPRPAPRRLGAPALAPVPVPAVTAWARSLDRAIYEADDVELRLSPAAAAQLEGLPLPDRWPGAEEPIVHHTGETREVLDQGTRRRWVVRRGSCGLSGCGCLALQAWPADHAGPTPGPEPWAEQAAPLDLEELARARAELEAGAGS